MDIDKLNFIRNLYKQDKPTVKYEILETDVEIILKQVDTTREKAIEKLTEFNGDLVKAIIAIFDTL